MQEVYQRFIHQFVSGVQVFYGKRLVSVVLYGSVARGNALKESDIDILLVVDGTDHSRHRRHREILPLLFTLRQDPAYQELERMGYCHEIMPLILSREEVSHTIPLYFDMVEDGIILYDDGTMRNKLEEVRERMRVLGSRRIVLEDGSWYWDLKPDLKPGEVFEI